MKKFYVYGMIRVVGESKLSGGIHSNDHVVSRWVYSDSAENAKDMVYESAVEKYKRNKACKFVRAEVLCIEVFERVGIWSEEDNKVGSPA